MARHWRPLFQGWAWTAGLVLTLYAFVRFLVPAAEDMLRPVYALALIPGIIGAWSWIRPRRTNDRRADDRRQSARRDSRE